MSSSNPGHLIERAAQRLGDAAALSVTAPVKERTDIGRSNAIPLRPPSESPANEAPASETRTVALASMRRAGLIGVGSNRDRISEEFRVAVSHILRSLPSAGGVAKTQPYRNLMMITSARPGEGKSFITLNLAASIAHYVGRPVLLVDGDAKQDSLSQLMGLSDAPGLLDLALAPSRSLASLILATDIANLAILPIGGTERRAELSASFSIANAVERLAINLSDHIVLLDAPPCLSSSDGSALAPLVGMTVLVVEAERTQRQEVESALEILDASASIALLLNKIVLTKGDTFGAYSYGAYS
jgi:protein-tyrosine kinase